MIANDSQPSAIRSDFRARAHELVSKLTLEEKIAQLMHDAPGVERVGIAPFNWWSEALHGVGRAGIATVFPQAIGMAATWNPELVERVADAIATEARAKHHAFASRGDHGCYKGLTFWTPNLNIVRDPRWGRTQETYGECPYLTARIGVAFVRGLQGDDECYLKVVATPKHFAVHSGPESSRHGFDAQVSQRDLRETYLPAFEACIREGKAASVMTAYNRMNGEPCCASKTLIVDILRFEWGFEGYVVSDCGAIDDFHSGHRVTQDSKESAALGLNSGCDLNCGVTFQHLNQALEDGLVTEETIDRSLTRLMEARMRLGMFDPSEQVPYASIPFDVVNCPEHQTLALNTARESIVLLRNDAEILPLRSSPARLAVIGPTADNFEVLMGNYPPPPTNTARCSRGCVR